MACDWGHVDVYIFTQHKTCRIKYSSRHIMKLKGMWVSYKKTSWNFGCRGSSEAEPQLFCQCREGAEPRAQSSPFLLPLWKALMSPRAFLLMFFVCFSPLCYSTACSAPWAGRKSHQEQQCCSHVSHGNTAVPARLTPLIPGNNMLKGGAEITKSSEKGLTDLICH